MIFRTRYRRAFALALLSVPLVCLAAFAQVHFTFTSNTGSSANVLLLLSSNPNVNGTPLSPGDEVGAFAPSGICVGSTVWDSLSNKQITVWGDNSFTPAVDGIVPGQGILFSIWRHTTGLQYDSVSVTYASGGLFDNTGVYGDGYFYSLSSISIAAPPEPPALLSPAQGSQDITTNPTLRWSPAATAASYHLQISTSSSFASLLVDQSGMTSTSYAASGLSNGSTYYWRVNGTSGLGTGIWSTPRTFTTAPIVQQPAAPTLVSPSNGATGVAINPALTWNSVSGATSYRVQVSTSATFATTVVDQANITTTSYAPSALTTSTTYYWHVSAANSAGTSAYSSAWNFTTAAVSGGLVAAYAFDEGTGTTITDLSGLGLSGTISGAAWTTQGKYNNALSFNGTSSYVDLGNPAQLQITGSMTWSAWVRAAANPPDDGQIIAKSDNTTGWQLKSSHDTGPQTFGVAVSASSSSHTQRYSTTVRSLNTWYHVAGVYNATARTLDIYVNGVLDNGTLVGTVPASQYVPSFNVNVGQRSGGYYFNGIIDELRVYSRALTQAEIQTDMNTPLGTPPSQPAPPVLASPANGATNQPTTVTLSWNTSAGATSYRLQASTDQAFGTTVFDDSTITGTSRQVGPLSNSTTYYWRVRAKSSGGTSAYSTVRNFTTIAAPPVVPTLTSPANGATGVATNPTLTWNASTGATSYRLQASTDQAFGTTVFDDSTITGTSRQVGPLSGSTTYYWRVRAKNSGGTSAYSTVWNFATTAAAPAPPTLIAPIVNKTGEATTLTLLWSASAGATTYRVQLSVDPAFGSTVVDDSTITGTSRQVGPLAENTTYYWRVRAKSSGGTSAYSSVWSFTTGAAVPAAPTLASPPNGAADQSTTLTLSWNASPGAASYHVQVSTSTSFATPLLNQNGITGTSYNASGLTDNTTYYWRVSANNTAGSSPWSAPAWRFVTGSGVALSAPSLIAPTRGSTRQPTTLIFMWNTTAGATQYHLRVSSDSQFVTTVFNDSTVSTNWRQVGPLANKTAYYWNVRARSGALSSAFSPTWNLTTIARLPSQARLRFPQKGASNVPTSVTLSWDTSADATTYRLQLATDASFISLVLDDSTLSDTSSRVDGLAPRTAYYWRVQGQNEAGVSAWSDPTGDFTTAPSTFVDENGSPYDFALYQNYPNPFNPTTKITFSVPVASDVRLSVLNLIGQEVAQLVNEHLGAGTYRIEFSGEGLSNGVYFYRMKAGNFTTMRRMILLK